jgi:hypothetical protein
LAARLGAAGAWPVIATDVVRKELAGLPATARAGPQHYSPEFSARTYGELLRRAAAAAARGERVVLLDGNFATPELRAEAAAAARAAGAAPVVLTVLIDEDLGRRRVATRIADPQRISDAGPDEYAALLARFRPPTPAEGIESCTVTGAAAPAAVAAAALVGLLSLQPNGPHGPPLD